MKTMTAREAKNHFGEFLDSVQREPVIITKNNRPVGLMMSIRDAADLVAPEMMMDKEPGYDNWVFEKVTSTIRRLDSGESSVIEHTDAIRQMRARLKARLSKVTE